MINESESYEHAIQLAKEKRSVFGIKTGDVTLSKLRQIYRQEKIKIDMSCGKIRNLRAAYFNDDNGCSVLLNRKLPKPARIFSLAHELKHHFTDQHILGKGIYCSISYKNEPLIEKTAELFAAELIWPEDEFLPMTTNFGIVAGCTPEDIVRFKRYLSLPISYQFLKKRFTWFKFIDKDQYKKIQFQKLEQSMYGVPFYLNKRW